jgi:putative secretion ATPase (PEP-CTERM system associated)
MYEQFYGFREKPFQLVPNPTYLFKSSKHQNALTYLEYGIKECVGFILLTGEVGAGKTTLIQYLLSRTGPQIDAAVIFNTQVNANELLAMIMSEFELEASGNKAGDLGNLHQFLIDSYAAGKQAFLIIDEAQNLSTEALEEVRMLSNLHSETQSLLQIMLVGQPELKKKLKQPSLRQFTQRIAASYHLTGISKEETGQYIAHRLKTAGGRPDLFTPAAAELVHDMSGGIPRAINLVCQAALVYGFADESKMIGQDVIHQINKDELSIGCQQAPVSDLVVNPSNTDSAGSNNGYKKQLAAMEKQLRELKETFSEQLKALEMGPVNNSDAKLVGQLKKLLSDERRRNEELSRQVARLEMKNEALHRLWQRSR